MLHLFNNDKLSAKFRYIVFEKTSFFKCFLVIFDVNVFFYREVKRFININIVQSGINYKTYILRET